MIELADEERLNYFPGSPLFTATLTFEGQLHVSDTIAALEDLRARPVEEKRLFQAPKTEPHTSWNPSPLHALTLAFFPDAWLKLGGTSRGDPPSSLLSAIEILEEGPFHAAWPGFWNEMSRAWSDIRGVDTPNDWVGSNRLKDWALHVLGQVSQSSAGRSLRSAQRHLQLLTGQNRKSLEFFTKIEEIHRLSVTDPDATPAQLATEAGFADQSHMGRTLKRATGFSPATLNRRIATEEAFWCYRLLGSRF